MVRRKKKGGIFHRITAILLMIVMTMSLFPGGDTRAASGEKMNVARYKGTASADAWTAPTEDGKIFAGWYEDDTFETPCYGTDGEAYAKFVDSRVLSAKKQVKAGTTTEDAKTDVRFLTSIDTLNFRCAGFEVTVSGKNTRKFDLRETVAYDSVLVDGVRLPQTASQVFGTEEAKHFVVHTITNIPQAAFDDTFTVKPYWYTMDGTLVYGKTDTFTIREKIAADSGDTETKINSFRSSKSIESLQEDNAERNFNIAYLAEKEDQEGVSKQGVVMIELSPEKSPWPMVKLGKPICGKPVAGRYDYVVFTMYVEGNIDQLTIDYKDKSSSIPLYTFQVRQGWTEYWLPADLFDYESFQAGNQFLMPYINEQTIITQTLYIDSIRYVKRKEAEVTDTTAEFLNFSDTLSQWEFVTQTDKNEFQCSYVEEFEGAKGLVRLKVTGQWPEMKGYTPRMSQADYEELGYTAGDYFVIKFYKANPEEGVIWAYNDGTGPVDLPELAYGWNTIRIDAGVVLNNWDKFVNGPAYFMPASNNREVNHDLYFDSMYFEKNERLINGFDSQKDAERVMNASEAEQVSVDYLQEYSDGSITKQGVVRIDLATANSPWPLVKFGAPLCKRTEEGTFDSVVFTMYVEGDLDNFAIDYRTKDGVAATFRPQRGWKEYWLPAELFDWDAFASGEQCFGTYYSGNTVTQKIYIDSIRFENRSGTEITKRTAEFQNFSDSMSLWEFATQTNRNDFQCSYAEEFEGAKGLVRLKVTGTWPEIRGFTPRMEKQDYVDLGYGAGDYFVMRIYKANADGGVGFYYNLDRSNGTTDVLIGSMQNGWNTFKIDAGIVLDNWDKFVDGTTFLMSTNNNGITHDLYFDSMYFEKKDYVINGFDTSEDIKNTVSANTGAKFQVEYLEEKADSFGVTKQGVAQIDLSKTGSAYPVVKLGTPLCDKPADGKYDYVVFTMYAEGDTNTLLLDYRTDGQVIASFKMQNGWKEYWVPEDQFDWEAFTDGSQFLMAYDNEKEISQTLYIDNIRYEKRERGIQTSDRADVIVFAEGEDARGFFATKRGWVNCSYVSPENGDTAETAVRYQNNGQWLFFDGFVPVESKETYQRFYNGKFVIEMNVNARSSVNSWAGDWPKLYFHDSAGVEMPYAHFKNTGKYTVEIPASVILDNWDGFLDGRCYFFFADGNDSISIDCSFTGMYFAAVTREVLLYDFEDYDRNFQLMRVMTYFGAVSVNEEADYVKHGKRSALLQPLGYHSTMITNTNERVRSESCLYIPFTSKRFSFDFSDATRIRQVRMAMYNAQDTDVPVYMGLIFEKNAVEVSEPARFVLKPGWNMVNYTLEHDMLALNYDLEHCYGAALIFDRTGSRERKDAPKIYLDDIRLVISETPAAGNNVIELAEGEICDFEKPYQKYVMKSNALDKAMRPDMKVVSAAACYPSVPSGNKLLRAVLKPTDCIDGTIYDGIYLTQSVIASAGFGRLADSDRFCFDLYNGSSVRIDFSITFSTGSDSGYKIKRFQAEPNAWTTFEISMDELDGLWETGERTYRNDPGEIQIKWAEFTGRERVIYLDHFRIER